ncbi:DUF5078 domain-containing protein [Mycolicibacterium fallax]|nr:hypothetical protein MFAL_08830 [Mycolicibacterium fallax]
MARTPAKTTGLKKSLKATLLAGVATAMLGTGLTAAAVAGADATDEYPIPSRILKTPCTAQQYLAAVRDTRPIYYERYMIDYNNKPAADQQGARDRINWFFSMDYPGRRQYSEQIATDAFYESMSWRWPNWAKPFFNNKGVTAAATKVCMDYPDDYSVWDWPTVPR